MQVEGIYGAKVEQDPAVHEDVEQPAVEEAGRDQAPPLPHLDQRSVLCAELNERLGIDVDRVAVAGPHAVNGGDDVEPEVDEQNQDRVEARVRDESADDAGDVSLDRARPNRFMAIGTDAVLGGDEGPAMRAHSAGIHFTFILIPDG